MRACFLDRDGTLNIDYDFVHRPQEWDWITGVPEALQQIQEAGFTLFVITNQSGVARGRFTLEQVKELHDYVESLLRVHNIHIKKWYIAPWHPDFHEGKDPELLAERKPGTALFKQAEKEFGINLQQSVMIGDKASDLIPAIDLGIKPYLVESRFMNKELKLWCEKHQVPVYRDLPQLISQSSLLKT